MKKLSALCALGIAALVAATAASGAVQARDAAGDATTPACTSPEPVHTYAWIHCYTPQQIRAAYGVDRLDGTLQGQGQTIVLVDSYGEPTGPADLKKFHDAFFAGLPPPNFTQVYPNGAPDYKN